MLKFWRVVAVLLLAEILIVVVAISAESQQPSPSLGVGVSIPPPPPPEPKTISSANKPQSDQRGTAPIVVQVLPAPISDKDAADIKYREKRATSDRWLVGITGVLALAALLQWGALGYQSWLLRKSIRTQAADMGRYVTEAARTADAMEKAAAAMAAQVVNTTAMAQTQTEFWQKQMRAYVGVIPGAAFEQNTTPGSRFECQPLVQNDGLTPAYDLIYRARTTLLPHPLPPDFDFSLPEPEHPSRSTVNPRANVFMINLADSLYSDAEYAELKRPGGRRLYTYGSITYRDGSDTTRYTNFCFYFVWGSQGRPAYIRTEHNNDSN